MNLSILHRSLAETISDGSDEIDARRALADVRKYAREHREEIDAEWNALPDGRPWTLEDHVAGRKL